MAVTSYVSGRLGTRWKVDHWASLPSGKKHRIQKRSLRNEAAAVSFLEGELAKLACSGSSSRPSIIPAHQDAPGSHQASQLPSRGSSYPTAKQTSVETIWAYYRPICLRDKRSGPDDCTRAKPILRILGKQNAASLNLGHIDDYRTVRFLEKTRFGTPPSPATLDREIALLKVMLSYAVKRGDLALNPLTGLRMLNVPNTRSSLLDEETFQRVVAVTPAHIRPIILVLFDTGMRKQEVLRLRWNQVDLDRGRISLTAGDTKTATARHVYLPARTLAAIVGMLPPTNQDKKGPWVFPNAETGKPFLDILETFRRACERAGLNGIWVHDLRRSFATRARRRGISETTVMAMGGWKTAAVFRRYSIIEERDLIEAARILND